MWLEICAGICLAWYAFIALVCGIGYAQLFRYYLKPPSKAISSSQAVADVPHVTVIRPCKGYDPYLYECLAATFRQDYPGKKLTIYFCLSSRDDVAYDTIKRVLADFPAHDAKVYIETEDPALRQNGEQQLQLGPNPKIRNMSRAYREAKGDIVWLIDCNVWVGRGACGRMVDKLCGLDAHGDGKAYKFVHHLPISIDVESKGVQEERQALLQGPIQGTSLSVAAGGHDTTSSNVLANRGGRLEELFLSSSHAKFYTAISTVAVAPCIVGKSNMFRRSHLNYLTSRSQPTSADPDSITETAGNVGIDYFSYNICEDHLIGDLLWRSKLPDEPNIGNHGLVFGDLAIQPMAGMSVTSYIARRVRWLRVRKFTVTLATWVEPGVECFLCSAYGAFAITTLPWFHDALGVPQTSTAFGLTWLLSVAVWAAFDWTVYLLLQSGRTTETDGGADIPAFARPLNRTSRRPFWQWLLAWLGREALALPIWMWAIYGGVTVVWRDRSFWVGMDMRVHEINEQVRKSKSRTNGSPNGHVEIGKARTD